MKGEECWDWNEHVHLLLLSLAGERILSLFPSDFLSPLDGGVQLPPWGNGCPSLSCFLSALPWNSQLSLETPREPPSSEKEREGSPHQSKRPGGRVERMKERMQKLCRGRGERNVLSGICCASREEGSVTFLIIINTWRQICQHCSGSLGSVGEGSQCSCSKDQYLPSPPPLDRLSIAAASSSPSNCSPPHHSPPFPWSLYTALASTSLPLSITPNPRLYPFSTGPHLTVSLYLSEALVPTRHSPKSWGPTLSYQCPLQLTVIFPIQHPHSSPAHFSISWIPPKKITFFPHFYFNVTSFLTALNIMAIKCACVQGVSGPRD